MGKKRRTKKAKMKAAKRWASGARKLGKVKARGGVKSESVGIEQSGGGVSAQEVQVQVKSGDEPSRQESLDVGVKESGLYAYPVSLIGRDLIRSLVIAGVVMVGLVAIYWFGIA
jgi:hypothetical protein